MSAAAKYFRSKGGVVTMSAGNEGATISLADNPYIVTVSATGGNDSVTSWSNRGDVIDVAAPGLSIYTTTKGAATDRFREDPFLLQLLPEWLRW